MPIKIVLALTAVFAAGGYTDVWTQPAKPGKSLRNGSILAKVVDLKRPVFPHPGKCVFGGNETVYVQAETDSYGNVYSATAISGHLILRYPSERAAYRSRFTPTKMGNILIGAKVVIAYRFFENGELRISVTARTISVNPEIYSRCSDCTPIHGNPIDVPPPTFPAGAIFVNASGEVIVEIIVNEEGTIESARAVTGHIMLRKAALEAALRIRFPAQETTKVKIRRIFEIRYNFVGKQR